jgi:precorrin-4/cobalt-precorrin-4 C11-methyltransferase
VKIYFIGAGPGDPELLTIKGKKIVKQADIIIYAGSLVNKQILKWRKKGTRTYNSAQMSLEQITEIFIKAKQQGKKVIARIHTGDPCLYGAIQEQMSYCKQHQIDYEVIAGVSSFSAAAAVLKQELTLPGLSQSVIISRLGGRTKVPPRENLEKLAKIQATLVLFLSVDKLKTVIKKLLTSYPKNTPVAIISRASWPDQKIIKGTLTNILAKNTRLGIKKQALIFVGDVLKQKGFSKSKLYDKNFSHMFRDKE